MTDVAVDQTHPATRLTFPSPSDETTVSPDLLAEQAGFLRNRARLLGADVADVQNSIADLHRTTLEPAIGTRTVDVAKRPLADLLHDLSELGFSWRAIADLCEVSVPALRKSHVGASEPTAANRQKLAQLLAVSELLGHDHLIDDVAAWLEIALDTRSTVTGFDLLKMQQETLVVELAGRHRTPANILDEVDPAWRERQSQFEITEGPDGDPLIRPLHRG